jgi:predicted GNAT family acetyltransferase
LNLCLKTIFIREKHEHFLFYRRRQWQRKNGCDASFNRAALNIRNDQESSQPINYNLQDNGVIIGGIHAYLYFLKSILHVDHLFVEEKYRGQDLGSVLLEKVEKIAKEYGATLSHLDIA